MRYYDERAEDFDKKLAQVAEMMTAEEIAAGGERQGEGRKHGHEGRQRCGDAPRRK